MVGKPIPKNLGQKNLYKGNIPPGQAEGTPERKPFRNDKGNVEIIQAARARDKQLMELSRDDPEAVQEELYAELSRAALRLTRKLNGTGGEPSRLLIEAWREVRQAGLVVLEIRRSRGSVGEAEGFFAELGERMEGLLGPDWQDQMEPRPLGSDIGVEMEPTENEPTEREGRDDERP